MASHQQFNPFISKILVAFHVSLLLTACSTEENIPGSAALTGDAGTVQAATPEITPASVPDPAPVPLPAPMPTSEPTQLPDPVTDTNKPAVISGNNTGVITEDNDPDRDNLLEVGGKLNISDRDAGESAFRARTRSGSYGNLSINAAGDWNYTASNSQAAIQSLAAGARLTDTIQVSSIDGTSHSVIITISGANDATIIGGVSTGSVTEDVDPDRDGVLEIGGKLNISDRDAGESAFRARTHSGTYGSLSINAAGNWNYTANNNQAAIQALAAGAKITDTIRVSSIDGTARNVIITIMGANDATIIGGVNTGSVTEDVDPDSDNLLETSGKLTIADPDAGDAVFINETRSGLYGSFSIDASGNWSYAANNKLAAIQDLNSGAAVTDTLRVSSIRGATRNVVITINGVDESDTTADITLSWIAPTEREDGTAISMAEIAGYRVYYGTSEGNYPNQVEVADRTTMQVMLRNMATGTYYIVVTAYDTDGRESAYSSEVAIAV